jgi:hypothetical protein
VFAGIGHFDNYHVLRRRDFITPFIKNQNDSLISDDKNYGQTENFYLFLKKEYGSITGISMILKKSTGRIQLLSMPIFIYA